MIAGITIFNSQVYLLVFFSLKNTPYNLWVMRVFTVWVKNLVKQLYFLPNRMFHRMTLLMKHSQTWQPGVTLQLPVMCFTCGLFPRLLLASYSRTALIHFLKLDSSSISHTHLLQINPHTYKENDWRNYKKFWHGLKANTS